MYNVPHMKRCNYHETQAFGVEGHEEKLAAGAIESTLLFPHASIATNS